MSGPGDKKKNMFQGLSVLRANEPKKDGPKQNSALQAYLQKYTSGPGETAATADQGHVKKKKKKAKPAADQGNAIKIVDQDLSGFAAVKQGSAARMDDEDEDEDDYQPVVVNKKEAKAYLRMMKKVKEGSGWVSADQDQQPSARRHPSPDASPPRRGRHDSPDASPSRRARHDSPDASPPRRARQDSPDASPPRRGRHDSPDASPPRRPIGGQPSTSGRDTSQAAAAAAKSGDLSPPRKRQRASPDPSPPRRGRPAASPPDASPPRRARHNSPDASPPRRGRPDASPPRRSHADASPPRRPHHVTPDASPPRRGKQPDASPPRRGRADASPPRRARHDSPDASPPRRLRHDSPDVSPPRKGAHHGSPKREAAGPGPGPDTAAAAAGGSRARMNDGTVAGLVSARELQEEAKAMRAEAERRRLTAEGRGASTVFRDKASGRVVSEEEYAELRRAEKEKDKKKREREEIHVEWKTGLAQQREAEEKARRMAEEAAKPFARHALEAEVDAQLKERARFGDPMAGKLRKAAGAAEPGHLAERYGVEKLEKSGFIIPQEVPPHSWLKRRVPPPLNRYNIRPGRHWDGVDRSNGFEKKLVEQQYARHARELEARLWTMSDM